MANLSQQRRQRMLTFLETLKKQNVHNDNALRAIGEIENELNAKKYGLVWEQHEEAVDVKMKDFIPVFTEDKSREIAAAPGEKYNFLLEGDNLHSLYLLEKTLKGKVSVIYLDPPYNTKNKEFVYDDKKIDATDGYRHSKWLSFMNERLVAAKELLADDGVMVISIGYQEVNNLMLLCQEVFPPRQVVCVTVQTSSGNAISNGFTTEQEYLIFITPLDFEPNEMAEEQKKSTNPYHGMNLSGFNQTQRPNQAYPIYVSHEGKILGCGHSLAKRIAEGEYQGSLAAFQYDYNEAPKGAFAIWPITRGGDPCVWRLIPEKLMENWNKGYIKVTPNSKGKNKFNIQYLSGGIISQIEEGTVQTVQKNPDVPTLDVIGFKTAAKGIPTIWTNNEFLTTAGSKDIKNIFGKKVDFPFPKPVFLLKTILQRVSKRDSLVLDFFAGSGTTAQAVLELNQEDGGHRHFILCTNNENQICENVTYPRVKTVISGIRPDGSRYSDGIPANLKYYRTDFVARDEDDLPDALLAHISEMIQLENGIKLDGKHYLMVLTDEEAERLAEHWSEYPDVKAIYISSEVLLTSKARDTFADTPVYTIPDYYFDFELREEGELW